MSQKSKLRRKQRNERANARMDDDQPGRQYGDAAEYFEQKRIKWEKSQKEANHGKN